MAQIATTATGRWSSRQRTGTTHGAYWQHVALSKVIVIRNALDAARVAEPGRGDVWQRVEDLLDQAQRAAHQPASGIRTAVSGSQVNRAFVNLHTAQVMLAGAVAADQLDTELLAAMTRVRCTMPPAARRREELERRYAEATAPAASGAVDLKRWVLKKALEWSYAATDAQYARLRSFRNILSGVSIAVLFFAVLLALLGVIWPEALQLCFGAGTGRVCPTGTAPTPRDAVVIEILGAAGGALVAVLGVRRMQGTSTPYSVPLALALLKLPLGALTAILGLVLVQGRFVPGLTSLDTPGQILAYAIAFGVAQHVVTATVDRRGQELLSGIPGKRSAGTTAPGDGGAPPPAK